MAAKKRTGLPFVVQPRLTPAIDTVGTEDSGIIEIERRGYLNVQEKAFMQAAADTGEIGGKVAALAHKISTEKGISKNEALEAIQEGAVDEEHVEEYGVLIEMMQTAERRRDMIAATCLIVSRVDPNWTATQTLELHPDLVEGLAKFYHEEEEKNIEALAALYESHPANAEEAGKE